MTYKAFILTPTLYKRLNTQHLLRRCRYCNREFKVNDLVISREHRYPAVWICQNCAEEKRISYKLTPKIKKQLEELEKRIYNEKDFVRTVIFPFRIVRVYHNQRTGITRIKTVEWLV